MCCFLALYQEDVEYAPLRCMVHARGCACKAKSATATVMLSDKRVTRLQIAVYRDVSMHLLCVWPGSSIFRPLKPQMLL